MDNFNYYTGDSEIPFLKKYCNLQEYCEYQLDAHNPAAQLGLMNCAEMLGIKSDEDELHRASTDALLSLECLSKTYNKEEFWDYVCDAGRRVLPQDNLQEQADYRYQQSSYGQIQLYFICDVR